MPCGGSIRNDPLFSRVSRKNVRSHILDITFSNLSSSNISSHTTSAKDIHLLDFSRPRVHNELKHKEYVRCSFRPTRKRARQHNLKRHLEASCQRRNERTNERTSQSRRAASIGCTRYYCTISRKHSTCVFFAPPIASLSLLRGITVYQVPGIHLPGCQEVSSIFISTSATKSSRLIAALLSLRLTAWAKVSICGSERPKEKQHRLSPAYP